MCVHVVCPTCTPHSLPHALVVYVEPWEQLELPGWIDVTGQWLWADREDSIYVFTVQDCVQTALRYATQHQHLGMCRKIFNTGTSQEEIDAFQPYFTFTHVQAFTSCFQVQKYFQASIRLLGVKNLCQVLSLNIYLTLNTYQLFLMTTAQKGEKDIKVWKVEGHVLFYIGRMQIRKHGRSNIWIFYFEIFCWEILI